ncbi:CBS domain-containing protein [Streptosporangium sp. NPDC001681]|uniref:CBS domain-containing protein n=1 Tax=Streptosporangium sp. NPDC001681 TaxID=3154395 RepID=UPI0033298A07
MRVKVNEVMTRAVASVNGSTPFKDVAEVLIAHGVSAVPVVDAENHVLGVVSEADLLAKEEFKEQYYREGYRPPLRARLRYRLSREGRSAKEKAQGDTAAELMTAPAVTIAPNAPVVSAMRLMDERGVKRLPVVDREGRLEGIVSRQDLLKVFLRTDDEIAREIREDVLDHSLWVDTSQVKVTVKQGIAKLSGHMARHSDALIAARMALRVHGVVDLIDELEWDEDDVPAWQGR